MNLKQQTPSQTIGPYFAYGLTPIQYGYNFRSWVDNKMSEDANAINIYGKVYDGEGQTINDAMIELWQNDGKNQLFGRYGTGTEENNQFSFTTLKPNSVNKQAPFINVIIFMRGQLLHSYTRIYFSDEDVLNEKDSILQSVSKERRQTLIANKTEKGYEFNIHMQGPDETVFFQI
ncbi:protocatechuate 3,4-dioxygenase subunit alpha [Confluentibacter flavum]|uniref:Protocatechuate 3,4-dioxygenase subunit alpha n=1 Tax=Confluentibacter flavum TaxID=1909700 RepID=A0A2N3HHS5_9FLAO|nr:protocatechuate 3,4-dioxygenase subunit alpha [Confluentibacter flavum]PKQ44530.1 protocatechuate 3,4-dioxygenase subunit alpha [Confluentibacter flavum]